MVSLDGYGIKMEMEWCSLRIRIIVRFQKHVVLTEELASLKKVQCAFRISPRCDQVGQITIMGL